MQSFMMRLACVITVMCITARAQEKQLAIIPRVIFTTTSEIFPSPASPDAIERARSYGVNNFPGGGLELRATFPDANLAAGVSVDYLRGTTPVAVPGLPRGVSAEDGFEAVPIEITGYFMLPIFGERFSVLMGGGIGVYLGRRLLRVGGQEAEPLKIGTGFGIHVLGGGGYRLADWLTLTAELKFRDVQFDTATQLPALAATPDGRIVTLSREPIVSRVHIDGMLVQIGAAIAL